MLFLSLFAGLLSGICWLIGDIYLVGFEVDKKRYGQFVERSQIKNKDLSILMLSADIKKLRFGALIANFSIPLMLFSLYGLLKLTNASLFSWVAIIILGIAFSISPLAHVAFYYVGITSQAAYQRAKGEICSDVDAKLINETVFLLDVTWRPAIALTGLGWLLYSILILINQTFLPIYMAFLTPLFGSLFSIILVKKVKYLRPSLNGAAFNMALTFFFLLLLVLQWM